MMSLKRLIKLLQTQCLRPPQTKEKPCNAPVMSCTHYEYLYFPGKITFITIIDQLSKKKNKKKKTVISLKFPKHKPSNARR